MSVSSGKNQRSAAAHQAPSGAVAYGSGCRTDSNQFTNKFLGASAMKIFSGISRACLLAAIGMGGSAMAQEPHEALILGDSVAFSYIASVGYEYFYINPDNFIGFPNLLGEQLGLIVRNGSCPGETTGSFMSSTAPDNGCRAYRELFPLHAAYKGT